MNRYSSREAGAYPRSCPRKGMTAATAASGHLPRSRRASTSAAAHRSNPSAIPDRKSRTPRSYSPATTGRSSSPTRCRASPCGKAARNLAGLYPVKAAHSVLPNPNVSASPPYKTPVRIIRQSDSGITGAAHGGGRSSPAAEPPGHSPPRSASSSSSIISS